MEAKICLNPWISLEFRMDFADILVRFDGEAEKWTNARHFCSTGLPIAGLTAPVVGHGWRAPCLAAHPGCFLISLLARFPDRNPAGAMTSCARYGDSLFRSAGKSSFARLFDS